MLKKFVYPAVVYFDNESQIFVLDIHDCGIIAEASTVEEVHLKGSEFLKSYVQYALKYECEIPEPTEFDTMAKEHPKEICILVEAEVDVK